jgi:hypothetical protein
MIKNLLSMSALLIGVNAMAQSQPVTTADMINAVGKLGEMSVEGKDKDGRKCQVHVVATEDRILSIDGTKFFDANSVETAGLNIYNSDSVLKPAKRNAIEQKIDDRNREITLRLVENVERHKTDVGHTVCAYNVNYKAVLQFADGKLVGASVSQERTIPTGFFCLPFDPDFRGGKIQDCKAR